MGDEPAIRQDSAATDSDETQSRDQSSYHPLSSSNIHTEQAANMDFESYPRQHFSMGNYPGPGALDMSNMATALPDYQMRQYHPQAFPQQFQSPGPTNQHLIYQYQQGAQFTGQPPTNYNYPFAQQYPPQYIHGHQSRQQQASYPQFISNPPGPNGPQHLQNHTFIFQQPVLHNSTTTHQQQLPTAAQYPHQQSNPVYAGAYGTRMVGAYQLAQQRVESGLSQAPVPNFNHPQNTQGVRRTTSNSSLQTSVLRGPPRKPKQSGHALWVGNLPPAADIIDLKDHFSRDATEDIESVFLISKSNCAFVNYKTEEGCAAAMTRFHDSRFKGVRLVCRLRRGSISVAGASPSRPKIPVESAQTGDSHDSSSGEENTIADGDFATEEPEPEQAEKVKEKFFVVKSLTVEDLERSVHSGIWATQAHNETSLNGAFESAENVYLIFSANKSGEYFGYARMESGIDDVSVADIEYQPRREAPATNSSDLPLTIPTPATSTAPKGRIIDDSARGTIFWEADMSQKEKEEQNAADEGGDLAIEADESANTSPATPQTFGKPFKIKWMSTDRLPFYRTRGLRNPWNANREVKIARDGTEIEPTVGRRLISMFHRPSMPTASSNSARHLPPSQGGTGTFMPSHGSAQGGMYGGAY